MSGEYFAVPVTFSKASILGRFLPTLKFSGIFFSFIMLSGVRQISPLAYKTDSITATALYSLSVSQNS
jgi:hypothetical protein